MKQNPWVTAMAVVVFVLFVIGLILFAVSGGDPAGVTIAIGVLVVALLGAFFWMHAESLEWRAGQAHLAARKQAAD